MSSVGSEGLPLPEDMTTAALSAAKTERGLTYLDIAKAVGVGVNTVANWITGRTVPRPRYHAAIRRVLHLRASPEATVWVRHYGREYKGTVTSVGGHGAWISFRIRNGAERVTYAVPTERAVYLGGAWLQDAIQRRGLGPLGGLTDRLRGGEVVVLREPDFETQALANNLDRMAGRAAVDRGDLSGPEGLLS